MKTVIRSAFAMLFVFAFLMPVGAMADAPNSPQMKMINSQLKDGNDQLMFVLLAKKGHIQAVKGKTGIYQLTLTHVNPRVIFFTDRPARRSGQMDLQKFTKLWTTGSFKKDAPNAVMESVQLNVKNVNKTQNFTVKLTNPSYQASTGVLKFDIKSLPGNQAVIPKVLDTEYVALFIDNACTDCGPIM